MALRAGMTDLVLRTRRMVNDAGSAIWSDDEDIQDVLDLHRQRVYREPLEHERTLVGSGSAEYTVYHSRYGNYEAGGTAYFQVEDSAGTQRGTADYTADYIAGIVTMAADQMGTALYLTGWSYDLNGAAADLWQERAGALAERADVSAGDNSIKRSQMMGHALDMAEYYRRQARARTVRSWTVGLLE